MSEPVRILNLFTIMNRGGAETMVMNYYRHIDRSKIQFDFMVHRSEKGAYDDEIEALGGHIYRMCPVFPQNFIKYRHMLKVFFDKHPEYRIIHSHMSELGCFAFLEAEKRGGIKKICHAHNAPNFKSMTAYEKLQLIMRNYFKLRMRPYTDEFFICGYDSGDWLFGKKNRGRFVMMNNAVDAQKFRFDEEKREDIRKKLGIENKFAVINIGRFNPQKNHTFLIDIFEKIKQKEPDSVLLLAGNGELEEKIREKVKEKKLSDSVMFLGLRDDIDVILQGSDLFLMPSLYEGLPVTMVEAQASGIKCVISDGVPKQCVITDNVDMIGLSEHPEHWARKILEYKTYERRDMLNIITDAGFDVRTNAKWLENFYLNLIE